MEKYYVWFVRSFDSFAWFTVISVSMEDFILGSIAILVFSLNVAGYLTVAKIINWTWYLQYQRRLQSCFGLPIHVEYDHIHSIHLLHRLLLQQLVGSLLARGLVSPVFSAESNLGFVPPMLLSILCATGAGWRAPIRPL